ncbi:hypothetical protein CH63R_07975 [Colletotrichum higginsianum IMI 349063]|uniref:Uncharacterized protein n=1 Tax=Colletotrichum higginsianum (strain IMI 349063) TaxID=759273 RepID=A0A1B7YBJ5_COLHI|nr:hypothetical protein CH63R_07975 [Colletotrichum higginsianum IMI 349063]OBR09210.1 hypothetical protein CH63R_07975 [Colletotrichum higginsianum IMI 349063]
MVADDDPPANVSLIRYVYHDRLQPLKPRRLSTDKRVVGAGQIRHGRTTAEPAVMTPRPAPPAPPPPCLEADGGSRSADAATLDPDSNSNSDSAADAPRRLPGSHLQVQPRLVILPLPLLPQPLAQRLLGLADVRKPLRSGPLLRLRLRLHGRRHGPPLACRVETPRGGALASNHGRVRGAAHRGGVGAVTYTSTSNHTARGRASRDGARVGGFAVVSVRPSRAVTPRGVALVSRAELAPGDDQGIGGARGWARGVETSVQSAVAARGLGRVGAGGAGALVGDAVSGCRRVREVCGRLGTRLAVAGVFGVGRLAVLASVDRVGTAWRETGSRQV